MLEERQTEKGLASANLCVKCQQQLGQSPVQPFPCTRDFFVFNSWKIYTTKNNYMRLSNIFAQKCVMKMHIMK